MLSAAHCWNSRTLCMACLQQVGEGHTLHSVSGFVNGCCYTSKHFGVFLSDLVYWFIAVDSLGLDLHVWDIHLNFRSPWVTVVTTA